MTEDLNDQSIVANSDDNETCLFKSKIIQIIDQIRYKKKKRPDINGIYDYIMRTEATNVDKEFIETVIVELINEKKITNKNTTPNQGIY